MKTLCLCAVVLSFSAPAWAGELAGLVYGTDSGALRREIIPDDDKQLDDPAIVQPGESLAIVDKKLLDHPGAEFDVLARITGKDARPGAVAVVGADTKVEALIAADPALDTVQGKSLIKAFDGVAPGQTYDSKTDTFTQAAMTLQLPERIDLVTGAILPARTIEIPETKLPRPVPKAIEELGDFGAEAVP